MTVFWRGCAWWQGGSLPLMSLVLIKVAFNKCIHLLWTLKAHGLSCSGRHTAGYVRNLEGLRSVAGC